MTKPRIKYQSVPVTDITPGARFTYASNQYVRATEDEAGRHPSRELQGKVDYTLVYAYMLGRDKRTPVSFVPSAMVVPQ